MSNKIQLYNTKIAIADNQFNLIPLCAKNQHPDFLNSNQYDHYVFSCLTQIHKNNITLYNLPKNFKVYRGDISYGTHISHPNGKMSFNVNAKDASDDGYVHEFLLSKSIDVLCFDEVSNLKMILTSALNDRKYDVVRALKENYSSYITDKKAIINHQLDNNKILDYVYLSGYEGFAHRPINGRSAQINLYSADKHLSNGTFSQYNDQFLISTFELKIDNF